ncbi:MAG: helix-turn-helix domain-containing protein [Candidatus Binataceae bacterium]|jgi:excisionase family DNA binding protein
MGGEVFSETATALAKCAAELAAIAAKLAESPAEKPTKNDRLIDAKEMAERLDVPETWIRDQERAGKLPSVRAGKYVRFRAADVLRAIEDRKVRH